MAVDSVKSSSPKSSPSPKTDAPASKSGPATTKAAGSDAPDPKSGPAAARAAERTRDTFTPAPGKPSGTGAPATVEIDPRIQSEAGIDLKISDHSTGTDGQLQVSTVRYQSDLTGESRGNHNVYVRVLDPSGNEIPPEDQARWFDVRYRNAAGEFSANPKVNDPYGVAQDAWTTSQNTGAPTRGYFDIPMFGHGDSTSVWIAPKNVPGNPYANFGSQEVGPLDMPGNHHVNYLLTFQPRLAGALPPTPPPSSPTDPWGNPADPSSPTGDPAGPTPPAGPTDPSGSPTGPSSAPDAGPGGGDAGPGGAADAGPGGAADAGPSTAPVSARDLVESVYRSELGRDGDATGLEGWELFVEELRKLGLSDAEIRGRLVTLFRQSPEYLAKHPLPSSGV